MRRASATHMYVVTHVASLHDPPARALPACTPQRASTRARACACGVRRPPVARPHVQCVHVTHVGHPHAYRHPPRERAQPPARVDLRACPPAWTTPRTPRQRACPSGCRPTCMSLCVRCASATRMHVVTHVVSVHDPQCASTTRMQDPKCALPACTSQRVSIRVREPVRAVRVGHPHPAQRACSPSARRPPACTTPLTPPADPACHDPHGPTHVDDPAHAG